MTYPSTTCICITRKRPSTLRRSINCFLAQTYGNRELLVVYEDDDPETRSVAAEFQRNNIRFLEVPVVPKLTLGALRNLGIKNSKGDLICQWDDDDWYHERRLEFQVTGLLNSQKESCIMGYWLMYNSVTNEAFMAHLRMWEGSILCRRSILKDTFQYPELARGEDKVLVDNLVQHNKVYPLIMPQLYVYIFHENNTWDTEHFSGIYRISQKLSSNTSLLLKKILNEDMTVAEGSHILSSHEVLSELQYVR
jgi:glycosyltransferase involved in cell wall biosynthesis